MPKDTGARMQNSPRYYATFADDGSVYDPDGLILGSWDIDPDTDAFFRFTPEGADEPLLIDPFKWSLGEKIEAWHKTQDP